jgi:DNA-binding protein HU-beta
MKMENGRLEMQETHCHGMQWPSIAAHHSHERRSEIAMKTHPTEKGHVVVGRDELIHQIAARAGLPLKETSKVIDAFTDVVRESVAQGHEVRLMGFGTWTLRHVAARQVKSIRGGDPITIPARLRVGFSVGAVLSQAAQPEGSQPKKQKHRHH